MSGFRDSVTCGGLFITSLAFACQRERPSPPSSPTRAESTSVTLPTDPAVLASILGVPPDSLRHAAEERYGRQSFDSARAILAVEVLRARAASDFPAVARAQMWLGLAQWRLGDYAAARRDGESSLALKRKFGLDGELSRSFNALGLLAWNHPCDGQCSARHGRARRL
jgi:hypothetical protein